jgi:predicted transport protein
MTKVVTADAFMAALDHPLKAEFETLRAIILGVDPAITDGVKWNSISFRTTEWFATINLRSTDKVQVILHLGAKVGKVVVADAIEDPKGLLVWLGKDRATLTLNPGKAVKASRVAVAAIIQSWIASV